MPRPNELEAWILKALSQADAPMDFVAVSKFIWENHEAALRASGRGFFRWQLDARDTLFRLKKKGLIQRSPQRGVSWEISGDMTNPFEAMCRRASDERWCWNLGCTTCGQQDFRYGLLQIANRRHPASDQWDRFDNQERGEDEFQSIRSIGPWASPLRRRFAEILSEASLETIARQCRHPDWLGYLGVTLAFAEQDDQVSKRLSKRWLNQLIRMVDRQSVGRRRLTEIRSSGRCLTWMDLDGLERDIFPA